MESIAYPYQMPQERGTLKCFLLALFMHVLLGTLLYYAVHWQSRTPAGVEAELWDAEPDVSTQPVIQPKREPPQPVVKPEENADIALQARKRRQAAAAAEAARQAEQRDHKAREAERQAAAKQQRLSELARLQAMANSAPAPATDGVGGRAGNGAGRGGTASPGYADRVRRRILPNIIYTEEVAGNPTAVVAVHLAADGSLLSVRLAKSSGNVGWDNAVLRAVERSDPLPRDENGVAPPDINIYFQPKE
ncbi:cell envelope integrity protein TolA [Cupriavidus sp. 2TAF22]|uniref:cell envelope integrity protein TolA n=1 Tax=unclassified Cupriavidus TaxID=2640874 RepID=UPI003F8E5244